MKAETTAEQIMFCTVRMEGRAGAKTCSGTGFIYTVPSDKGDTFFLVTNRHVAEGMADVMLLHFLQRGEDGGPAYGETATFRDEGAVLDRWTFHSNPEVDVAVRPLLPILKALTAAKRPAFFKSIGSACALTSEKYDVLDAIEDVIFVGYPSGLYDQTNSTPIVRTGTTATPVALDYEGQPLFLIDASVFGGSSGSPLLVFDRGGMHRKRDGSVHLAGRFILLGVVAAVYERKQIAELVQTKVGVEIANSLHLGRVFKAEAIDDCVDELLVAHKTTRLSARGCSPSKDLSKGEEGD